MKNLARTFSAFVATMLLPALCFAAFPDVNESSPYFDAIDLIQQKGVIEGYQDGLYRPYMYINRAEFVKILVASEYTQAQITSCKDISFTDVKSDDWFAPYLCVAQKNNIISGYPDGTFKGYGNINFVESAKILVNTLEREKLAGQRTGGEWYQPYVDTMALLGAIPVEVRALDADMDRGMTAEMIYRLKQGITDKPSLLADEMGDRRLIESYYNKIAAKDLEGAFAMKVDPGMSLATFKEMYAEYPFLSIYRINKTGRHTYSFRLMTFPWEKGGAQAHQPAELYNVEMEVSDGKLKTISSVEPGNMVLEDIAFDSGLRASIEFGDGFFRVFTVKDGKKKQVAEYDTRDNLYVYVDNLYFSPNGNYLMYQMHGWEYGGIYLYDIVNGVLSDKSYDGISLYGMTADEKYFYVCNESGMISGAASVLEMPGFKLRRDLAGGKVIDSCGPYDSAKNSFKYTLVNEVTGNFEPFEYYISSDEVKAL
jgi:hypothetical protein